MVAMWALAVLAGHEMWTPGVSAVPEARQTETTSISIPLVEETGAAEAASAADPYTQPQFTQPQFDVYGNQIDEAVGDYRVDPRGDLYEQHSPDTAILKLGPPGA